MVRHLRFAAFGCALAGVALLLAGCGDSESPSSEVSKQAIAPSKTAPQPKGDGEHAHKPGSRGGIVVPIGGDNYHAEVVFEKGGVLRLYMLGRNESVVAEVESQPLTGYARLEDATESESFVLAPKPQPGDKAEMTSLFVGHLPKGVVGKKFVVTVPVIRIGGERLRFAFTSATETGDHDVPSKVANDEEQKLYLTPGGKYTTADIKANGNMTASVKFKGLKSDHDLKPKSGEKVCPVTLTKANPKFSWVIDGKTYEFCCPPCVDEFVALAKEKPEEIMPPEFYRKK
ncbi:MAG: hypothetical protein K8U57_37600 [Planctomycetes bacterium]|nr:hypothetical protein [Planctomycetota bacterium]